MKNHKLLLVVLFLIGMSALTLNSAGAGRRQNKPAEVEEARLAKVSFSVPQRPRPWDKPKEIALGAAAPDWRLKTATGEAVALSELRGKVVVLDFWAHWCVPCHRMMPKIDELAREYRSKPVKFFTLSIRPSADFDPRAFLKEHKTEATFLLGDDTVDDNYGIWGLPTFFVINPEGKVAYIHVLLVSDAEALGSQLREAIEKALPKQ